LRRGERIAPKAWLHAFAGQRGHLLLAQGKFAEAEKMFLAAHDTDLDRNEADHLILAGSAGHSHGDLKRAESLFRMAAECEGGAIEEVFFNLGGVLLAEERFREAADCYERVLEIDAEYEIAKERFNDVQLILITRSDNPKLQRMLLKEGRIIRLVFKTNRRDVSDACWADAAEQNAWCTLQQGGEQVS
jgi:tetratricopeptide (TPR) repeat protein